MLESSPLKGPAAEIHEVDACRFEGDAEVLAVLDGVCQRNANVSKRGSWRTSGVCPPGLKGKGEESATMLAEKVGIALYSLELHAV